jgi:hypothetical protein
MNEGADSLTWLAEHQRAHCDGGSALTTFQELLIDEILVPQSAIDAKDPAVLVRAASSFTEAMQNFALFLPGEFAQEALWSFHVEYYRAQVSDGGHAQYVLNSNWAPISVRCCAFGLKSMVADPHLDLLTQLIKLKRPDARAAKKLAVASGFRDVAAAIRDLDRRFAELEKSEPLTARHRTWLKSQRKLKIVDAAEMREQLNSIAAANPLRAERQAETERARLAHEAADPAFQAVRSLCDMAGLQFGGLGQESMASVRSAWPEGPDGRGYVVRVATQQGERTALFFAEGGLFKKPRAVLIEAGQPLPLADLTLSRAEFLAIAPAAMRGK